MRKKLTFKEFIEAHIDEIKLDFDVVFEWRKKYQEYLSEKEI